MPTGTPLAILGAPRSGTELLMELLASHPQVRCAGELFEAPPRAPLSYVAGRAALARARGYPAWLFKLLFHRLKWFESSFGSAPEFLRGLLDRGFTIVLLERRNRLMQALSFLHAERTQYHFRANDSGAYEPLDVDPAEVIWAMHEFDSYATWGRAVLGDLPRLELWYEDDLASPERQLSAAGRVFAAAGLEAHVPASAVKRVAPTTARERVRNYDDLVAALATTRFASFVRD